MMGRVAVLEITPSVDCGTWPARAVPGEQFPVSARVFTDGHDRVGAQVVLTGPDGRERPPCAMTEHGGGSDHFRGFVSADCEGDWTFRVEGYVDVYSTWRHSAVAKVPVGSDVEMTLADGADLLDAAASKVPAAHRPILATVAAHLRDASADPGHRLAAATAPGVLDLLSRWPLRAHVSASAELRLQVDRRRALTGSGYEFFPRSEGASLSPRRSGTLAMASLRLPAIAAMGFDVVYLPPIHPIGLSHRKGPNNSLTATPDDVGVPWAIGSAEGGHLAIHPDLGDIDDFDRFVTVAADCGLEVALDLAVQCSPDHPWVTEHPDWFSTRRDGSIAYAENPPKKYQDIYPLNFDADPDGIHAAVLDIIRYWAGHGVRIFRVDNPHTKPLPFWERLLAEVRSTDPDILFLAEAFTRPPMMSALAKIGFHQSYTYFTWRTGRRDLEDYVRELAYYTAAYMRPNFFTNTPDILHAFLQHGGRPAFEIRAVLAATLSPSWGIYAGFELCEATAVREGSEEYLNSEKYELRPRDWAGAEESGQTITDLIRALNSIRRAHPALQQLRTVHFHDADSDHVIVFSKREGDDIVLVIVSLQPHSPVETVVHLDLTALGVDGEFSVRDELDGCRYRWSGRNFVRLTPGQRIAHIFTVHP